MVKASPTGTIGFEEDFKISGNIPFERIAKKRISVKDKDSTDVAFKIKLDSLSNTLTVNFDKTESNRYNIQVLPNTFVDFFDNKNDTLNYTISTKTFADYGNVRVNLKNVTYPVIVQLTDDKGEVKVEKYSKKPEPIDFKYVTPNTYYLRVVHDSNKNGQYDSGNFLKNQQPEKISYFPDPIDVRANWDPIIDFTLL